ncbi:MAG TPA: hypothetical protein VHB18_04590 [Mycobacteriales bacterium]|jgi:hypothetical protein|nr:hypothetical protein [Mycobacteriales bacterium]
MRRAVTSVVATLTLLLGAAVGISIAHASPRAGGWQGLRAGAAVVDATWHVGASAGQYASQIGGSDIKGEWDPNVASVLKRSSYGVASRLSISAIVLQDGRGDAPIALVRDDNYLAQDMLTRRVAQLLQAHGTPVAYNNILVSALHDHSSPYYSTPAAGVWLFEDVMDLRMFEYQARQMASAIEQAYAHLRPAEVGATTVQFPGFQGNIAGADVNEDGSPTGYPQQDNDHELTVMRIDDLSTPAHPRPLATWVSYAEHGESLDEYDLISQDWMAPFMHYMTKTTGVPMVFSQGAVGSSEGPYEHNYPPGEIPTLKDHGQKIYGIYGHMGFAQAVRGAHVLYNHAIAAWRAIGGAHNGVKVDVPFQTNPRVKMLTRWYAGPLSHPYPSVSNCRTGQTLDGDVGVPVAGLPDCERLDDVGVPTLPFSLGLFNKLKAAGLPIPDNYDAPSALLVEENLRIKLQAVRIGQIILGSCACEPQADLTRNFQTRTDRKTGNEWLGMDYGNQADVDEAWPVGFDNGLPAKRVRACYRATKTAYSCPDPRDPLGAARLTVPNASYAHMEAQIHNNAAGWNSVGYLVNADSEPAKDSAIKGNFTHTELGAGQYGHCPGYRVSVTLGHTGDYNGYTVSYREYEARDSYRKALTAYGPHSQDYYVTNLLGMAANLLCGTPVASQPTDPIATLDEVRQSAEAVVLGQITSAEYTAWAARVPDSVGPAKITKQPHPISRFDDATVTWVGGDNWTDNPTVTVQRKVGNAWKTFANQSGAVQVVLNQRAPLSVAALKELSGQQRWTWTASMEAFDSYPRADVPGGQVPNGAYRFVVNGAIHTGGSAHSYHLVSKVFRVRPWHGIKVRHLRVGNGRASFTIPAIRYPRLPIHVPAALKRFYADNGGGLGKPGKSVLCATCSFMPWATVGHVKRAVIAVIDRRGHVVRQVRAHPLKGHPHVWAAKLWLKPGQRAAVPVGGVRDSYGESNGHGLIF